MNVIFIDHNGQGRRLLNLFPSGIAVFRPDQEYSNMLHPVGHSATYYPAWASEFAKAFTIYPGTWTELVKILLQIERGMKPSDPYLSLKDFENVLWHLAGKEKRSKLETAAHALASLNAVLGRTARIRKAPDVESLYKIIVYESQGLPPRVDNFLSAIRLLRTQLKFTKEGDHA